jgi:hypothetical protein
MTVLCGVHCLVPFTAEKDQVQDRQELAQGHNDYSQSPSLV